MATLNSRVPESDTIAEKMVKNIKEHINLVKSSKTKRKYRHYCCRYWFWREVSAAATFGRIRFIMFKAFLLSRFHRVEHIQLLLKEESMQQKKLSRRWRF